MNKPFDKNYIGFANEMKSTDERLPKYIAQYQEQGFDDTVTWNLGKSIAQWVLPRLIRYKEINNGYPDELTEETWNEILDDMILAFRLVLDANYENIDSEKDLQIQDGLTLFAKYFRSLWW